MTSPPRPDADVAALGDARYQVTTGDRTRIAYAVAGGRRVWVFLDGRGYLVEEADPRSRPRVPHQDDEAALASPMPATVAAVRVAPGDRVSRGDVLLVLEAMKMELPIVAPREGTVQRLHCAAGDLVQPGTPLVTLD